MFPAIFPQSEHASETASEPGANAGAKDWTTACRRANSTAARKARAAGTATGLLWHGRRMAIFDPAWLQLAAGTAAGLTGVMMGSVAAHRKSWPQVERQCASSTTMRASLPLYRGSNSECANLAQPSLKSTVGNRPAEHLCESSQSKATTAARHARVRLGFGYNVGIRTEDSQPESSSAVELGVRTGRATP